MIISNTFIAFSICASYNCEKCQFECGISLFLSSTGQDGKQADVQAFALLLCLTNTFQKLTADICEQQLKWGYWAMSKSWGFYLLI